MREIQINVNEDGVIDVLNVPEGVEIHVYDSTDDSHSVYGEGDNELISW